MISELLILAKATALLLLGLSLLRAMRRCSASVRHAVCAGAFAALALLPLGLVAEPVLAVKIVPSNLQSPFGWSAGSSMHVDRVAAKMHSERLESSQKRVVRSILAVINGVWLLGFAAFLAPIIVSLFKQLQSRRSALPWTEIVGLLHDFDAERRAGTRIGVMLHDDITSPLTFGFLKSTILFPIDAAHWSERLLRASLTHELEHVRRRDWIVHLLARTVCAFLWFHPLVWHLLGKLLLEAERACDDVAAGNLSEPHRAEYAAQLVTLARQMTNAPISTALGLAGRNDLSKRVFSLLDNEQRRGRAPRLTWGVIVFAVGILTAGVAPLQVAAQPLPSQQPGPMDGMPLYPGSTATKEAGPGGAHQATLSISGVAVASASAGEYTAPASPTDVITFYSNILHRFGTVTVCTDGTNRDVSVSLNPESFRHPRACQSAEFGLGETELKVRTAEGLRIVTIWPVSGGSAFRLVHVRYAGEIE